MAADRIQYHMCHTVHGSYSSSVKRTKRENIFRDFIYNDWNVFCAYSFPYHICHDPCGRIQSADAEGLILIHEETGLQIKDVLFAGVVISSLGAIMDVGMSVVSSLYEIYHHNPTLTAKDIFRSGIEIGKDMIGTMTNTLILAFTGSAFITLLVFLSYQVQFNQLINSNYLSIEIAQGLCGTFGIILTIPAASAISAFMLTRKQKMIP